MHESKKDFHGMGLQNMKYTICFLFQFMVSVHRRDTDYSLGSRTFLAADDNLKRHLQLIALHVAGDLFTKIGKYINDMANYMGCQL